MLLGCSTNIAQEYVDVVRNASAHARGAGRVVGQGDSNYMVFRAVFLGRLRLLLTLLLLYCVYHFVR